MIRVQSTKYFKSPPELWGRLSPGHVLTSFKARLGSDLRQSFYFSPSVHSCSADSSRQDMGAREPGELGTSSDCHCNKRRSMGVVRPCRASATESFPLQRWDEINLTQTLPGFHTTKSQHFKVLACSGETNNHPLPH